MRTSKVLINGPRGFRYVESEASCPAGTYRPFGFTVVTTEKETPAWAIFLAGQVLASPINDRKSLPELRLTWKKARAIRTYIEGGEWVQDSAYRIRNVGGVRKRIERDSSSGVCSWSGSMITVNYGTLLVDQFYVLLHELAHVCDTSFAESKNGHGPTFWRKLVELAEVYDVVHIARYRDGRYHRGADYMYVDHDQERYDREAAGLRTIEGIKDRIRTASRKLGTSIKPRY